MNIISLNELTAQDVEAIFSRADAGGGTAGAVEGTVGWSFEGNGIRTRTTFIQAFRDLGLPFTELPNLLKTDERVEDLAGYLDPYYRLFVVRESNHDRLAAFARASARPVINAMSSRGHPCEVLTDAYFIHRSIKPLSDALIALWGPTTNVFRSWHELARILGLSVVQICPETHHEAGTAVSFVTAPPARVDVVITDALPAGSASTGSPLTEDHLRRMGHPALLPTPPFMVGRELLFDPTGYRGFVGYAQKTLLLPVQKAIIRHACEVAAD
jgi:ornithine carbamoyltransferase